MQKKNSKKTTPKKLYFKYNYPQNLFLFTAFFLKGWVCFGLGLAVRDPATSLFHDEKFAFFEFGVRDTPKILEFSLGVPPNILKNVAGCR